MPIRITAQQNGYCRCNTVFSVKPIYFPDGHFNPQQLAQLKADPGLHVAVVSGEEESESKKKIGKKAVKE